MYGFPKSERGNINDDEEQEFREAARHVLSLSDKHLAALIDRGDFVEVKADE
ncbi:MAG: type II toxin-antitoxin system RelE/ParE family toxin [Acidobacteriota bacterium]|nr:type II toxin-antitoxin system RelE/ParE family toxin [Acidobacteriota bacterium]